MPSGDAGRSRGRRLLLSRFRDSDFSGAPTSGISAGSVVEYLPTLGRAAGELLELASHIGFHQPRRPRPCVRDGSPTRELSNPPPKRCGLLTPRASAIPGLHSHPTVKVT